MKTNLVRVLSLGLAIAMFGCARQHEKTRVESSHKTGFSQAGVSLVLGQEWQSNAAAPPGLRPPTLTSDAGIIRVVLLPQDRANPELVADGLRQAFENNPKAAKHSFRRQLFTSATGVQGICISYLEINDQNGRMTEVQNSHFLVRNRASRCVAINYLASAGADSTAVSRTIRSTLALQ